VSLSIGVAATLEKDADGRDRGRENLSHAKDNRQLLVVARVCAERPAQTDPGDSCVVANAIAGGKPSPKRKQAPVVTTAGTSVVSVGC
jgi:hypothetical protein